LSSGEIKQNTLHSNTDSGLKTGGMTTNRLPWQNTESYQHFGEIYCLILQVTIVNVTQSTNVHTYEMFYPVRWNTILQKPQILIHEMFHSRRL